MFRHHFDGVSLFFGFAHHIVVQPHFASIGDDQIRTDDIEQAFVDQLRRHDLEHLLRRTFQTGARQCRDGGSGRNSVTGHPARLVRTP